MILSAEEYAKEQGYYHNRFFNMQHTASLMDRYATYKLKALIEEVDEDMIITVDVKHDSPLEWAKGGAKWAKSELLKQLS